MSFFHSNSQANYNNPNSQARPHYRIQRPITAKPTSYYPQPQPTNTFHLNPLYLSSLKDLDVDNLQDTFGQALQEKNHLKQRQKIELEKMLNENQEILKIRQNIQSARLNQFRSQQINENHLRRMKELHHDYEVDELVLSNLEAERKKEQETENKKLQERLQTKFIQQQQMKDRQKERDASKKEYLRDKELVDAQVRKIIEEDINEQLENERKKNIARTYMENAYAEKAQRKLQEKEEGGKMDKKVVNFAKWK